MISLTPVQSLLACCLVLVAGRILTTRIGVLSRYSIPDPIVGGLLFAVLATALDTWGGIQISLETNIKPTLLLIFFGCIGLTADLKLLARGGPRLIAFLLALIPFLVLQNAVGLGLAWLLDMHPLMGLIGGTITLVGGHGTGAAYAARFADINNIQDVMALAMTAATIGLVLGGIIGGPVAEWLIRRHKLDPRMAGKDANQVLPEVETTAEAPTATSFITSLTAVFVTVVVGTYLAGLVEDAPISLPNFLWCLATGAIIRNFGGYVGIRLDDRVSEIIGSISLSLFLGLTMMTLDLSSVVRLAGPLALMLVAQALVCALYAGWAVFRMLKRDYEAAVMAAAFCGFAMGATATAIANMQALTRRHGPAPESFIVVPVTGAFLVDILNVIVLTSLIALPFVGGM
ncbi:sodium/glutamate symport carrier protein [Bordetella pertussis]|uniref:Sodium/glutamate symporter n=4 Tax=Bordetella pertussis TaxID=520 RepID=Q7VSK9_BORPE|nr:sodium/glutamate symporter [Bordetella pertussis]ETH38444.1 sodium/glutamate symporter [Bordetella pertussis H918]ETH43748.1 sodium/glutamate symporter [Bordetella pertussis H939]ETH45978.1 sodium/glutamate symporter [Bordetella pertussis H921]ETH70280.1 sodium/glutamate symporter [Bordetella pertussis STO1-CHLA-0011]ETH84715.1 sodium/glutamate symporter [Bordetella pertussis STO1-CHOC-0017]ETH85809.1 sodium/glutamate symporter [Bordetella pertussis STO1-CHOC-0018]ETH91391.1 sodium/glutam